MKGNNNDPKTKILIWQASIEQHEYYTWLALQDIFQISVILVLGGYENELRKKQGWKMVDLSKFQIIMTSQEKFWKNGGNILCAHKDAIHVFLGFQGTHPKYNYFPLIIYALRKNIRVAILNEPYSISPTSYSEKSVGMVNYLKAWGRPILYKLIAFALNTAVNSYRPCIFPISLIARDQFVKDGFTPDTLFPFGYFVPRQPAARKKDSPTTFRLVFLGVAIPRKGLDILFSAVSILRQEGVNVTLDYYGQTVVSGFEDKSVGVSYNGLLPFEEVQATIAEYDILVLPSRHDGWGVVVNEAMLQGIPVIVSDSVGSKCVVQAGHAGLVCASEDSRDLAEKIRLLIKTPTLLAELRANAKKVGEQLLPEYGAKYFLDALNHHFFKNSARPHAIWT